MRRNRSIYFDMDGTIANLYGQQNWLEDIISANERPYKEASTLVNMSSLARILNRLQKQGYSVGIVSWLAKNSTKEYDLKVIQAKLKWLNKHIPSVQWNELHIVPYGTPKAKVVRDSNGILFDDEERNRKEWTGTAYNVNDIISTLKALK